MKARGVSRGGEKRQGRARAQSACVAPRSCYSSRFPPRLLSRYSSRATDSCEARCRSDASTSDMATAAAGVAVMLSRGDPNGCDVTAAPQVDDDGRDAILRPLRHRDDQAPRPPLGHCLLSAKTPVREVVANRSGTERRRRRTIPSALPETGNPVGVP